MPSFAGSPQRERRASLRGRSAFIDSDRRSGQDRRRPVLLVTQNPDTIDMYVVGLRSLGASIVTVPATDPAVEMIQAGSVSAVVLDVSVADDWVQCELCTAAAGTAIPVIVVTGWVTEDRAYEQQAFAMGCAAYVAKPVRPERLLEIVNRARAGERGIVYVWRPPAAE